MYVGVASGQGLSPDPAPSTPPAVDAKLFPALLADEAAPVPRHPKWGNCSPRIARKPATHTSYAVYAEVVVYTNLDNDPAMETAALVRCMLPGGGFLSQIVAYDRDTSGKPVSLGAVAPPLSPDAVVGIVERGTVGVSARVVWKSEAAVVYDPVGDIRDYVWDGKAFLQVGDEASFPPPEVTDLSVTTPGPLVLTRAADPNYRGVVKFTVTNIGPNPTRELKLVMEFGRTQAELERTIGVPELLRYPGNTRPALQPGQSITVEIPVATDGFTTLVAVGAYSHIIDTNPRDNYATAPIVLN